MIVVEVDEIEEDVQKGDNKIVSTYVAVMNMEVESEPIVVQIKDFVNISSSFMISIDSTLMHNCCPMINYQFSSIDHSLVNIPISIYGMDTIADFKIWNGIKYDVILEMAWLR